MKAFCRYTCTRTSWKAATNPSRQRQCMPKQFESKSHITQNGTQLKTKQHEKSWTLASSFSLSSCQRGFELCGL